jgi:uncharacterized protein
MINFRVTLPRTVKGRPMGEPDFEQARRYALLRLERELPPAMCYHSLEHTRDDVAPAVERLAPLEGVGGEALLLLRTAAYFHDLGLLERREDHEAAGAGLALAVLPGFGYSGAQIGVIGGMIIATRLPQRPATPLEAILADGDLDVLGRPDFLLRNLLLRAELAAFGAPHSDAEWYRSQIAFLRGHRYWTAAARELRERGKAANLRALEARLATSAAAR